MFGVDNFLQKPKPKRSGDKKIAQIILFRKKVSSSTKHGFDLERGDSGCNDNVGDATMAKMMKAKATTTILATTAPRGTATTAFCCCRLLCRMRVGSCVGFVVGLLLPAL